mmetsp:Transcript_74254/g.159176  ORF Transcript_74254/g.159176 Transcript_74254/m.159176 type:complete len:215 (+) Transcript_74254:628-1272(+)
MLPWVADSAIALLPSRKRGESGEGLRARPAASAGECCNGAGLAVRGLGDQSEDVGGGGNGEFAPRVKPRASEEGCCCGVSGASDLLPSWTRGEVTGLECRALRKPPGRLCPVMARESVLLGMTDEDVAMPLLDLGSFSAGTSGAAFGLPAGDFSWPLHESPPSAELGNGLPERLPDFQWHCFGEAEGADGGACPAAFLLDFAFKDSSASASISS